MKLMLATLVSLAFSAPLWAGSEDVFACPAGHEDMMKYFVLAESRRSGGPPTDLNE